MIHTQYYALMRAIAESIQRSMPNMLVSQWDYNYNSKTFDSLKIHRNPKPFPKGIIDITNSQKQFIYPITQNASVGMNAADLVQFPNAFPIASVVDKFEIYGLTNRYTITSTITMRFETAAQALDFYHRYTEYYPTDGKYFYDFEYDYYLFLPDDVIEGYDPESDDAINIYAQMKDDSSNFELFSKCVSTPQIRCNGVQITQSKEDMNHTVEINFEITDSFLYMIMQVDARYWLKALSLAIIVKVEDFDGELTYDWEIARYVIDEASLPDFAQDADPTEINPKPLDNPDTNNDTTIEGAP